MVVGDIGGERWEEEEREGRILSHHRLANGEDTEESSGIPPRARAREEERGD